MEKTTFEQFRDYLRKLFDCPPENDPNRKRVWAWSKNFLARIALMAEIFSQLYEFAMNGQSNGLSEEEVEKSKNLLLAVKATLDEYLRINELAKTYKKGASRPCMKGPQADWLALYTKRIASFVGVFFND